MEFQWDPSLEMGYEKIDTQHKELFTALNSLIESSRQGKEKDEIFKTLEFLKIYTVLHFDTEEELQVQYDYPGYLAHKRCHDEFKTIVGELIKRLFTEGPTEKMLKLVTTTIGNWLLYHIKGDDLRMAVYIKSKEAEKNP